MTEKSFVLLTTSRRPSGQTRAFCKEFSHVFPNVVRVNRGKLSLDGVAEKALELDAEKVMIVGRWRGRPGKIQLFRIGKEGLNVVPPLVYVKGVKLRRDLGGDMPTRRRVKSVAIVAPQKRFSEVRRFGDVLSGFFDVPVLSLKEVYNREFDAVLQISADSSNHMIVMFKLVPELVDIGPHIRISHLVWEVSR